MERPGLTPAGGDARARFWAPGARQVKLVVGSEPPLPLERSPDGFWTGVAPGEWSHFEGQPYGFDVDGKLRADPYARRLQGQLRGVGELYLSSKDGHEVNKFFKSFAPLEPNPVGPPPVTEPSPEAVAVPFQRFEVQQQPDADAVYLRLFTSHGEPLSREQLSQHLGGDGASLVHNGTFWKDTCRPDGRIPLVRAGADAWAIVVNRPDRLEGLRYRFEVVKGGQVVGDVDKDGVFTRAEAAATPFNDPWSDRITRVNDQRLGIVTTSEFEWKNPVPRIDPNQAVTYQVHVGSFAGTDGNVRRSTFKDLTARLGELKELGINQIELLPTTAFEGQRDWGYIGTTTLAAAEQYGYVGDDGAWVPGDLALKRFIDAAHGQGIAVLDDVVYNHWGGEFNNLWQLDGKANSYLNWGDGVHNTPWGPMPAFNRPAVRNFIADSVRSRLDEYHFDGLRFDFTHLIHAQGEGGGTAGWTLLREITQEHPGVFLAAEEFPNHESLTNPVSAGGAGFDAMWNTEFQHRLVHDGWNPSVLQEAVAGKETRMDKFLGHLVKPAGFTSGSQSVTVISNHDEVGNADRTITVAGGGATAWQRGAARLTFATGMLSPGRPIMFQGEETLASNGFRWGVPSTWDTTPPDERHRDFCRASIALRRSSPAFDADAPAQAVHAHNGNSVFAYTRAKGGDEFLVVGSLGKVPQPGYALPLTGRWELVLNSDAPEFGGSGLGRPVVEDGRVDLPPAGLLVYRRVSQSRSNSL